MKCTCCGISMQDFIEAEPAFGEGNDKDLLFINEDLDLFYCRTCYHKNSLEEDERYLENYTDEDGFELVRAAPRKFLPGDVITEEDLGPLPHTKWATLC